MEQLLKCLRMKDGQYYFDNEACTMLEEKLMLTADFEDVDIPQYEPGPDYLSDSEAAAISEKFKHPDGLTEEEIASMLEKMTKHKIEINKAIKFNQSAMIKMNAKVMVDRAKVVKAYTKYVLACNDAKR